MKIEVYCRDCEDPDEQIADAVPLMKLMGDSLFNPDTKSQAQNYQCPNCEHVITVVVYPDVT